METQSLCCTYIKNSLVVFERLCIITFVVILRMLKHLIYLFLRKKNPKNNRPKLIS